MNCRVTCHLIIVLLTFYCTASFAGYRIILDPRSMAMGGTGVAAATKFNASFHNPALIAFNKGDKPDKIHISASIGARELYEEKLEDSVSRYQNSDAHDNFVNDMPSASPSEAVALSRELKNELDAIDMEGYREDETYAFSLLADTDPVTISFFSKRDIREMTTILNKDNETIDAILEEVLEEGSTTNDIEAKLKSSVDNTYYEIEEFGVTVATTNVIEYNMPISWGFSPKLIEIRGSHIATKINDYEVSSPPDEIVSPNTLLEWNIDIGFAMLLTDDFLENYIGLDGFWLEGEWVVGFVGMNMLPTDFIPYLSNRPDDRYPGSRRAVQALYQIGIAHYREDYMVTMDLDLDENEIWSHEGLTRFLSIGGEYYWRDDFHLRGGTRINLAQTDKGARDKAILSAGFLYQPRGFSIEGAIMGNDVEVGGIVGFGLAF